MFLYNPVTDEWINKDEVWHHASQLMVP